jgi:hypothetical protein
MDLFIYGFYALLCVIRTRCIEITICVYNKKKGILVDAAVRPRRLY